MRNWLKLTTAALGGLVTAGAVAAYAGGRRWTKQTSQLQQQLGAANAGASSATAFIFLRGSLAGLPDSVARYFEFALAPQQALIRNARFEQSGIIRSGARAGWGSFTATQHVSVRPRGFIWDAVIPLAPMLAVRVRDSYLGGRGESSATLGGLVSLGGVAGTREAAVAALVRFLAEAAWFPTALLPREGVTWTTIDDRTARAALVDADNAASIDVRFGSSGEIVSVSALRHRHVDGRMILTPWAVHCSDYARMAEMMIPQAAVVEWLLPDGPLPVWQGRVTDVEYEFAE